MVSVTVAIPEEIKKKMEKFPEMNWSGLVKKILIEKTKEFEWKEKMLKKLRAEQEFDEWAVNLVRQGRKGRFELKS